MSFQYQHFNNLAGFRDTDPPQKTNKRMKKYFLNRAAILAATALLTCGFTACSDDDDDGGSTPQGPTANYDGKLLSSVGSYSFQYDDKGRCVKISYSGSEEASIDYERGIAVIDGDEYHVKFNSAGYITSMTASYTEKEDGVTYKVSSTQNFSYNSDGRMTGGTDKSTETASASGQSYSSTYEANMKCTYDGGLLTRVVLTEVDKEDGQTNTYEETYDITYGSQDNKYGQWTEANENIVLESDGAGFVGLLGKASSKLIASYTETEKENGRVTDTETNNVTYGLNTDGTINTERIGRYSAYAYRYGTYTGSNGAKAKAPGVKPSRANGGKALMTVFGIQKRMESLKAKAKAKMK